MPRLLALLLLGALALGPSPAQASGNRLHMDVDVAYQRGRLGFVAVSIPGRQCEADTCALPAIDSLRIARLTTGIGYGVLTLEASVAFPIVDATEFLSWSAGFRLETSPDSPIGMSLRGAYVNRVAPAEGRGASGALAFLLRFHRGLHVYAEATLEATTVPEAMKTYGALFSYSASIGCGLRMSVR